MAHEQAAMNASQAVALHHGARPRESGDPDLLKNCA
jgi:hypothetical protein